LNLDKGDHEKISFRNARQLFGLKVAN